ASASDDRTIKLWNPATGAELHTLTGHSAAISALAVTPDGKQIVSAGQDHKVKFWDAETGREIRSHDSPDEVLLLAFIPDGKKLIAWQRQQGRGDDDSADSVQTYDPANFKSIDTLSDRGRRISCLALTTDGTLVAMGSNDGSVRLWDLVKKERIGGDRPMHAKALWDLTLTPDKKLLITA